MNISIQQQTVFYIETLIELPCQLVLGYYLIKHHRYILERVNGAVKRAHIPAYSQLHQLALLPTQTTGKNQCLSHGGCERIGCLSPILLKASQLKKSSSRGFQLYERLRWVAGVKRLKWCSIYGMIMFIWHYFRVREYATVVTTTGCENSTIYYNIICFDETLPLSTWITIWRSTWKNETYFQLKCIFVSVLSFKIYYTTCQEII